MGDDIRPMFSMSDCLYHERQAVLDGCKDDEIEARLVMWATACVQEAITVWRSIHPEMEVEMLSELMKTARR